MNVPADIIARRARILADRAVGCSTASDIVKPKVEREDPTPGNEAFYRGVPMYYDGRLPLGGAIAGTRPGDSTRWLSEIETGAPRRTC